MRNWTWVSSRLMYQTIGIFASKIAAIKAGIEHGIAGSPNGFGTSDESLPFLLELKHQFTKKPGI